MRIARGASAFDQPQFGKLADHRSAVVAGTAAAMHRLCTLTARRSPRWI